MRSDQSPSYSFDNAENITRSDKKHLRHYSSGISFAKHRMQPRLSGSIKHRFGPALSEEITPGILIWYAKPKRKNLLSSNLRLRVMTLPTVWCKSYPTRSVFYSFATLSQLGLG